jgi:hypothetical protein
LLSLLLSIAMTHEQLTPTLWSDPPAGTVDPLEQLESLVEEFLPDILLRKRSVHHWNSLVHGVAHYAAMWRILGGRSGWRTLAETVVPAVVGTDAEELVPINLIVAKAVYGMAPVLHVLQAKNIFPLKDWLRHSGIKFKNAQSKTFDLWSRIFVRDDWGDCDDGARLTRLDSLYPLSVRRALATNDPEAMHLAAAEMVMLAGAASPKERVAQLLKKIGVSGGVQYRVARLMEMTSPAISSFTQPYEGFCHDDDAKMNSLLRAKTRSNSNCDRPFKVTTWNPLSWSTALLSKEKSDEFDEPLQDDFVSPASSPPAEKVRKEIDLTCEEDSDGISRLPPEWQVSEQVELHDPTMVVYNSQPVVSREVSQDADLPDTHAYLVWCIFNRAQVMRMRTGMTESQVESYLAHMWRDVVPHEEREEYRRARAPCAQKNDPASTPPPASLAYTILPVPNKETTHRSRGPYKRKKSGTSSPSPKKSKPKGRPSHFPPNHPQASDYMRKKFKTAEALETWHRERHSVLTGDDGDKNDSDSAKGRIKSAHDLVDDEEELPALVPNFI